MICEHVIAGHNDPDSGRYGKGNSIALEAHLIQVNGFMGRYKIFMVNYSRPAPHWVVKKSETGWLSRDDIKEGLYQIAQDIARSNVNP